MNRDSKIVITGGAGLVGQNLVVLLIENGYANIHVIDKQREELVRMEKRHPSIVCICADLAEKEDWQDSLSGANCLFMLQAQITSKQYDDFARNTIVTTKNIIDSAEANNVPFTVFVSSSVVNSVVDDNYTRSKREQEQLVRSSSLAHCILRPTLMFGRFDKKHLGYLARFMERIPVFPVFGSGKYIRQPLYVRDLCRILIWCAEHTPRDSIYDITGAEKIYYIDIIKTIKQVKKLHTIILPIPVGLFRLLMKVYALFSKNPPFVTDQLDSIMANDVFHYEEIDKTFGITLTSFEKAIRETFTSQNRVTEWKN